MVSVCSLTLSERIRFQSCSLPVLGRTSCYSLFSSREVLGSLSKQSCHVAKLTEISVLCEILVVTKIAWLLCAARGVRVTHGTWCRKAAEVRMLQGPGNRQRWPPPQRGRPWVSVQTAQAICTALRASQCAWKDTLPSGEQDGASPCLLCSLPLRCAVLVSQALVRMFGHLSDSSPACGPSRLLPTCLPLLGPGHSLGSSIPVNQTETCRSRVRGCWKPVPPVGPHVDTVTFRRAWDELAAPSPAFLGLLTP